MARMCLGKAAEFKLYAPQAKKVSIAGTFNNWSANKLLARKDTQGTWSARVNLRPGRYEYKFVVDGNWINDASCNWRVPNPFGSSNCVIEIK